MTPRRNFLRMVAIACTATLATGTPVSAQQNGAPLCAGLTPTIVEQNATSDLIGTEGNDIIYFESPAVLVITAHGLGGDDIICIVGDGLRAEGGDGDDAIHGNTGFLQSFDGGPGNDTIHAFGDEPHMVGGIGDDTMHVGDGDYATVFGGKGTGNDSGNDTIYGGAGMHTSLDAEDGNNIVHTGSAPGTREIVTGDGNDQVIVEASGLSINTGAGDDLIDTLYHSQTQVGAGEGQDTIIGRGDGADIHAGPGDDVIIYTGTGLGFLRIDGGQGNDEILFAGGTETDVRGGDGNDIITSVGPLAKVRGDAGDDEIYGGPGAETFNGGDGNDIIKGGAGNDELFGDEGDDLIYGGYGHDALTGGNGDDELYGYAGHDALYGGQGRDILYGGAGHDALFSNTTETLEFNARADNPDTAGARMFGGAGNDLLVGGNRWDRMQGGNGDDQLWGLEGRDYMRGGAGNDELIGGIGIDDVNGNLGADTLLVRSNDNASGGYGKDTCLGLIADGNFGVHSCETWERY